MDKIENESKNSNEDLKDDVFLRKDLKDSFNEKQKELEALGNKKINDLAKEINDELKNENLPISYLINLINNKFGVTREINGYCDCEVCREGYKEFVSYYFGLYSFLYKGEEDINVDNINKAIDNGNYKFLLNSYDKILFTKDDILYNFLKEENEGYKLIIVPSVLSKKEKQNNYDADYFENYVKVLLIKD